MRIASLLSFGVALLATAAVANGNPPGQVKDQTIELKELHGPARVLRDVDGMPHVYAHDEHDALFLQGWLQAQDRLFQIDVLRRTASGTLAELLGPAALSSDVQLRTLGLRRAAERSLQAYTQQMRSGLEAYAAGVNAWAARNRLPPEYAALEITKFAPWSALDSAVIGKALAFQLSFDLDVEATLNYLEYQRVLAPINPQLGDAAFFLDVFRSAPFDPAASVPDATTAPVAAAAAKTSAAVARGAAEPQARLAVSATAERLLRRYRDQVRQVPFLERTLRRTEHQIGSNEWAVVGSRSKDGRPLVANDPHLGLDLPATFYQMQLVGRTDGLDAIGSSVTGTPWIVLGQNRHVTWGETTTGFDVTDTYLEQIQALPDGRLFTIYKGALEPIQVIPVTFRYNIIGDGQKDLLATASGGGIPPVVLVVPRRNNGPIVQLDSIDPSTGRGTAISVQWAGNGATRELETFRLLNRARNLDDFKAALQYFDAGSQNFIYGDIDGNIGYFTTGEVPLREDLQANTVAGAPPWFIREGTGGNEWLVKSSPGPRDGTGYEYLPFEELPQTVNPRNGFVVNANNDPAGVTLDNNPVNQLRPGYNGIYYLGYSFDFGTRAGRITQALRERLAQGRVGKRDMQAIQADVKLLDAEVLAPYIVRAQANAQAPGAPAELAALAAAPGMAEAVGRLGRWNYTAPTGLSAGYDAADKDGYRFPPSPAEVNHSIAATIYSVWRGQMIMNGVDRTLGGYGLPTPGSAEAIKAVRHLVERNGIGLSGIDFFGWAGLATAEQRRDLVLLASLKNSLDLLAGPAFAAAFGQSADQNGYRWGKLHRIVFDSVLGEPFSIPGATPGFEPSVPGLRGLSVDGGFGVVDASSHGARAAGIDDFMFGSGPNRRYVGSPGTAPGSIEAETILPGGMSGVLGNKFYANLLGRYLTNDTYPLRQNVGEVMQALDSQQSFKPKH